MQSGDAAWIWILLGGMLFVSCWSIVLLHSLQYDSDRAKSSPVQNSVTPQWKFGCRIQGHGHMMEVNVFHTIYYYD